MKQTFYLLRNNSYSDGTYLIKGEYRTLFPGQEITLRQRPTNTTSNILISVFRREIDETIQYLKPKTVPTRVVRQKRSR